MVPERTVIAAACVLAAGLASALAVAGERGAGAVKFRTTPLPRAFGIGGTALLGVLPARADPSDVVIEGVRRVTRVPLRVPGADRQCGYEGWADPLGGPS